MATIASASDDKITVVTAERGQKGRTGADGTDGVGFNMVRYSLINSPIVDAFRKNELTKAGSQYINWSRGSVANGYNRYGEFATVLPDIPRQEFNGWLVEPLRTNLLLNSETLSTQSVTVASQEHTLSFYGTGEIVMSGAYVGTLTGTGANDRVSLTFIPSAGSLTLTVTGTVSMAQLESGVFATSWITTEGAEETRQADTLTMPAGGNVPNMAQPFSVLLRFNISTLTDADMLTLPDGFSVSYTDAGVLTVSYGATSLVDAVSTGENVVLFTYDGTDTFLDVGGSFVDTAPATAITTTDPDGEIVIADGLFGWLAAVTIWDFALTESERTIIGNS